MEPDNKRNVTLQLKSKVYDDDEKVQHV